MMINMGKKRWQNTTVLLLMLAPLVVLILTALAYPFVTMARDRKFARTGWSRTGAGVAEAFVVRLGTNLWNAPDENVPVMCLGIQDGVCDKTMFDVHTNINVKTDEIIELDAVMSAAQGAAVELDSARYQAQLARAAQEEQERRDAEVWESAAWKSQEGRDMAQDSRTVQQANDLRAARERAAESARIAAAAAEKKAVDAQLLRDAEAKRAAEAERLAQIEREKQTALAAGEAARVAADGVSRVVAEAAAAREAQAKLDAERAAADKVAYAAARKQQIIDDAELARIEAARLAEIERLRLLEIARLAELARIEAERLARIERERVAEIKRKWDERWNMDRWVILYEDQNQGKKTVQLGLGDTPDLGQSHGFNDKTSSTKLSPWTKATYFEHPGFTGAAGSLNTGASEQVWNFNGWWNDRITSVRVERDMGGLPSG
jgi:hypothetical protein